LNTTRHLIFILTQIQSLSRESSLPLIKVSQTQHHKFTLRHHSIYILLQAPKD